jgi:DNA-binding HxlR family transcriptional regulator
MEEMPEAPLVRRSPVAPCDCNLAKAFQLIGDRWTLMILRSALYGVRRFDDLHAELGAPRSVLSKRLAHLVGSGIMEPREYREEGKRRRTEYALTEMGRALALPFIAMMQWGDRWLGGNQVPMVLYHRLSGRRLRVALIDESGLPADLSDVRSETGGTEVAPQPGPPKLKADRRSARRP